MPALIDIDNCATELCYNNMHTPIQHRRTRVGVSPSFDSIDTNRSRSNSIDILLNITTNKHNDKSTTQHFLHKYINYNNRSILHSLYSQFNRLHPLYRTISILLVVLLIVATCTYIITTRIVLYFSTGSVFYHSYDWYSYSTAAQRRWGNQAIYNSSVDLCYTVDDKYKVLTKQHIKPSNHIHTYILVNPVAYDLFPYLWDTILLQDIRLPYDSEHSALNIVNTDDSNNWIANLNKCNVLIQDHNYNTNLLPSYCHRTIQYNNLVYTFQAVSTQMPVDVLQSIQRILFVGDLFEYQSYDSLYLLYKNNDIAIPSELSIGIITMSDEGCNNPQVQNLNTVDWPAQALHHTLGKYTSLVAHTYGDCIVEQVIPLYLRWPLGPSTRHTFPTYLHPSTAKSIYDRNTLLNLQVTYHPAKPTRMQAWLTANEYCNQLSTIDQYKHLSCYIHTNDLLFKIASAIDDKLGTSLRKIYPFTDPVQSQYLPLLFDSRYTLCPAGKNPYDQYRIYESLMTATIPVIENVKLADKQIHPYGNQFRCTDYESFYTFKQLDAPVLYVNEWNELPDLLNHMSDEQLQIQQNNMILFYDKFVAYLRNSLLDNVKQM